MLLTPFPVTKKNLIPRTRLEFHCWPFPLFLCPWALSFFTLFISRTLCLCFVGLVFCCRLKFTNSSANIILSADMAGRYQGHHGDHKQAGECSLAHFTFLRTDLPPWLWLTLGSGRVPSLPSHPSLENLFGLELLFLLKKQRINTWTHFVSVPIP